ncbi:hypothetical protein ACVGVM_02735 [Pseudonocardia bannensis]|uniref:TrbL/VirB6 plasmid conjugal transfer protein n=1 Tax=Pseudonocardia bannensis TaxID=630973 RepID=A0A848DKT9_9PSEU|nr:hypothetical protein [Pseudonocardia bannensis]NMH93302.1 hypothetical protein [Pseudonocardia bannensis]
MTGPNPTAEPGSAFIAIVESAARAASSMAAEAAAAFAVPSAGLDQPAVAGSQSVLRPLLLGVLTTAVLVQSIRIVVLRRGEPLVAVATGLARFVLATALGTAVLQAALVTGDAIAAALLGPGPGAAGAVGALTAERVAGRDGLAEPFLLLLASVCVLLLAAALWMTLLVRQIALLTIAAVLPLAAAGSLTAGTRGWLVRLAPWAGALVVHKPAAALVFTVGAGCLGSPEAPTGVGGVLAGIVVLGLAVAVLPAALRLLSWSSIRMAGGWPAPGRAAPAGAVGAVRFTRHGQGAGAVALAGFIEHTGPGATGARPAPPAFVPWAPDPLPAPDPGRRTAYAGGSPDPSPRVARSGHRDPGAPHLGRPALEVAR